MRRRSSCCQLLLVLDVLRCGGKSATFGSLLVEDDDDADVLVEVVDVDDDDDDDVLVEVDDEV